MPTTAVETLARWSNFYLLTGSAAAALTGLQFIVQTLLASELVRPVGDFDAEAGVAAFGSPTVVHFSLALMLSAGICVPWPGYAGLRVALGALGAGALVYAAIVVRRTRRQRVYVPTWEDWLWHVVLPVVAYGAVLLAALILDPGADWALFMVAAATLLLLSVGIHNSWDTVTYLTVTALRAAAKAAGVPPSSPDDDHGTAGPRKS